MFYLCIRGDCKEHKAKTEHETSRAVLGLSASGGIGTAFDIEITDRSNLSITGATSALLDLQLYRAKANGLMGAYLNAMDSSLVLLGMKYVSKA